ncbi:MAG: dihydroorotase [Eubacteriales bacterium]|nr:dihydroorotase [Eubacteriales bacterium]
MNYLLKNAKLYDPYRRVVETGDFYIVDGKIQRQTEVEPDQTIDCSGKILAPGFIDSHCHLRDPGQEYKEDIVSGSKSGAKGGYVVLAAMPNTKPVCDSPEIVRYQIEKAEREGFCRVIPYAAASLNEAGEQIAPLAELFAAGARHVTDDGLPVKTAGLMREVMTEAYKSKMIVSDHCEDKSLTQGGIMNEGEVSRELNVKAVPSVAEDVNVARNILLSEYLDIPTHISHVSTAKSVELVREARAKGLKITAEVCPHHFTLTDECLRTRDANYRMYPPLRTEADRRACIEGLRDGSIQMIGTDHAPHHESEKADFETAMNGIVGLETAFPLAYKILVEEEGMDLMDVLDKFTAGPAAFLDLSQEGLIDGAAADLVLIDLEEEYEFKAEEMLSKSRNTPFDGWKFKAKILMTWWNGRVSYAGI